MSATRPGSSVRVASLADLDAILAIEKAWPTTAHWQRAMFEVEVASERSLFFVAEEAGRITGFACMRLLPPEAELLEIAVAPDEARRGIGRGLLESLHRDARARGCSKSFLEVRESNDPARSFYAAFGYRVVGRRLKYYNEEDALLMEAPL